MIDGGDPDVQLAPFHLHFPVFKFVGTEHEIPSEKDIFICEGEDENLTCQYLKADKENKLDKLHTSKC